MERGREERVRGYRDGDGVASLGEVARGGLK
jgi:hypothetical protein